MLLGKRGRLPPLPPLLNGEEEPTVSQRKQSPEVVRLPLFVEERGPGGEAPRPPKPPYFPPNTLSKNAAV